MRQGQGTFVFKRPGVAGAVILCGNTFKTLSLPNHKNQGAEILQECSPPTKCHMSCVKCHMSCVTRQMSHVTCLVFSFLLFSSSFSGQSGGLVDGGSVINGALPVQFFFSTYSIVSYIGTGYCIKWLIIILYLRHQAGLGTTHGLESNTRSIKFQYYPFQ